MFVDDDVAAEITKLSDLITTGGEAQQLLPVRNDEIPQRDTGIRMHLDDTVVLYRRDALARSYVDSNTDGALMQVGFAV